MCIAPIAHRARLVVLTTLCKKIMRKFQEEQDKLLNTLLEKLFFKHWKVSYDHNGAVDQTYPSIELFVTPSCNQKCEYCYLHKYEALYPREVNNRETILKNCRILFDWIMENGYIHLPGMDLFSGEIYHTQLAWDIFDLILEYMDKGWKLQKLTIPTNGSFMLKQETTDKAQYYIDEFRKRNCQLAFSFSIDGYVVDKQARPLRSDKEEGLRDKDFYDRVMKFAIKNQLCFHPMLAASDVNKWKENLDWWYDTMKKCQMNYRERVGILEVRNANWTEQNLKDYCGLLTYAVDRQIKEEFDNNPDRFIYSIFGVSSPISGGINTMFMDECSQYGCTIPHQLTIRLGDLAIAPCHRTAYPELLYGKFNVEDGKITGIEAKNVYTAMKVLTADMRTTLIGCDTCDFKTFCMHQCYGNSKEEAGDPFIRVENVCELLKVGIYHKIKLYNDRGYYDRLKELAVKDPKITSALIKKHFEVRDKILKHKEFDKYEV